jgi:hypothetical protein
MRREYTRARARGERYARTRAATCGHQQCSTWNIDARQIFAFAGYLLRNAVKQPPEINPEDDFARKSH